MAPPAFTSDSDDTVCKDKKWKKPLKRWDATNIVQIFVGPEQVEGEAVGGNANALRTIPLNVHLEVACYYSPVFKAAFNSSFKEGVGQCYRLEDVEEDVVKLLIHWFYNQDLDLPQTNRATKSNTDLLLCKLWILADRLLIASLQNQIICELERLRIRYLATSTSCIPFVYENTMSDSPLRRLFVSWCAYNVAHTRFKERPAHFPAEMLVDLMSVMAAEVDEEWKKVRSNLRELEGFMVEEEEEVL